MYYIYKRVSTENQSLIRQDGAISDYCSANNIVVPEENIFSDKITGKTIKRDGYQAMKAKIKKDDVLIILDIDRLGRSWDIIQTEWQSLTQEIGAYIVVVNFPLLNELPKDGQVSVDKRLIQTLMFTIFCYLSQKEVEKISERTKAALKAKRDAGIKLGRPIGEIRAQESENICTDKRNGYTLDKLRDKYGLSKPTLIKILKENSLSKGVK